MIKPVKIDVDTNLGTITISSRPKAFAIILFIASLIGLCSLPFSEYRHDYFAYSGLVFVMGLTLYYAAISIQRTVFENNTAIRVRKGFQRWKIPLEAVSGGYTTFNTRISRQSLARTHFLNIELQVDLPDNQKYWIRNGTANVFHYGFSQWGREQEQIREKFHDILDEKGIPILTPK